MSYHRVSLCICISVLMAAVSLPSRSAAASEQARPTVEAVHVDDAPVIDGQLDDACWTTAARVDGFYCSNWDKPAPEETVGLICADETAIYVAMICSDSTPDDIVADEERRNGDLSNDDVVSVYLDPTCQHRNFYNFEVNARGTQSENIPGGSATKIEWRGDWEAAAVPTPEGYQVEMAIPRSMLRCAPDQTTLAFALGRYFSEERVNCVWPNMGPTDDMTRCAELVGLPRREKRSEFVLMPYVTADFGDTDDEGVRAGLDVQYRDPGGLTGLAVLNPDYSQIEDVVEPISFSYTERYLSDPRPFFVTGQSGFLPREHLLYTRRIVDFDLGLKLFGTVGDERIGILDAHTLGEENVFAAAWKHDFDEDNWMRLSAVSYDPRDGANNLSTEIAGGRTWRKDGGSDGIWFVCYDSHTQGEGSGSSYSIGGSRFRGPGQVAYNWMVRRATPDFDPALGYYTAVNNYGGDFNISQVDFLPEGPVEARQWQLNMMYYPRLEGDGIHQSAVSPGYYVRTRSKLLYGLALNYGRYEDMDNIDAQVLFGWHDDDLHRRGQFTAVRGKRGEGGDVTYYELDQGFRPTSRLAVRLLGAYQTYAPADASPPSRRYQTVVTTSYDIATDKCVAARGIWTNGGFTGYASYRQVVRDGMDAYVIFGDPDPTDTGVASRVALKLIWAF